MLLSDLTIRAEEPTLVPPLHPTPTHVLYLSNLDDQLFLRFTIKYIFVYRFSHGLDPVDAIRSALSRVLVFYYPFAGRLRKSTQNDGKLEVVCNGEGALFVEADCMDLTVDEFDSRFQKPCKSWKKLLYKVDADCFVGIPPLVVQVTRLRCGGFVFCVGMSHCLCDGIGSSQFLHAWAEISRGATGVSVSPLWERESLLQPRWPPLVEYSHPEFTPVEDFCHLKERLMTRPDALARSSVCFTSEQLLELKKIACNRGDSSCNKCTSFEALSAHVWRCWIRAMDLPAAQTIKLLFSVNVRKRLEPQLPEGFYGNGFVLGCAETTVKELTESSLSYAVKLVQKAKATLTNEYVRSIVDYLEDKSVRPDLVASLVISQWSRLELTDVDFGWGKPIHVGPLGSDIYCLFLPTLDDEAVNVLLSVPRTIVDKYEYYMRNISDFRPPNEDDDINLSIATIQKRLYWDENFSNPTKMITNTEISETERMCN